MAEKHWSSLWQVKFENWSPEECPLCKNGVPITKESF